VKDPYDTLGVERSASSDDNFVSSHRINADYLRVAFASGVGVLRSMRSGKPIIPCNGGMWETEASGGVCS
jgi:hypothetical protein